MFGFKRVLFVGAHTDDEMVAAGTLHRLARNGADVVIFALSAAGTEGDRLGERGPFLNEVVMAEWEESVKAIEGRRSRPKGGMYGPSYKLIDFHQEVRQHVAAACEVNRPDAAFILSPNDPHPEHAAVGAACEAVMRGRVDWLFRCTFPWNHHCGEHPNVYFALSPEDVEAKRRSCEAYKSQQFRYSYTEMLMAAARMDGLAVKAEHAERFELVRGVLR